MSSLLASDPSQPWLAFADAVLAHLVEMRRADGDAAEHPTRVERERCRDEFLQSIVAGESGFTGMARSARLSSDECEVIAFTIACEIDQRRQRLLGVLQGDANQTRPTLQTIGAVLGGLERCPAAIGPESRVRRAALLAVDDTGPWAQQQVVAPGALIWACLGETAPERDLPPGTRLFDRETSDAQVAVEPVGWPPYLVVVGRDRVRRRQTAMHAARADGYVVTSGSGDPQAWMAVVREATLSGRGIVVELDGPLHPVARQWVEQADHLAWAITSASELPIDDLPRRESVELEAPDSELSDAEWSALFGDDTPRVHRLTPQQAEQVAQIFDARSRDIDAAVRRLLAGPLESLARRIRPRHAWDDLVLSDNRLRQLQEIIARYRHAGQVYDRWEFSATPSRGLVALFSGPSGTGKTLAAEVVAGELGLDMFKLDLSSIVSKYIGETEKNLEQVFEAAGAGNVVLFFDEADALFGKRSEVKDARDRYANVEVSYLLQRVEAFDGVVVLATNFEKSIDDAFLRRIHSRIEFAPPAATERLGIWRRHLPAGAPLDGVDIEFLADRFVLTGGQIRNASVHAAFLAADAASAITMEALVRGVATELRKAGRLLRPVDFGAWYDAAVR